MRRARARWYTTKMVMAYELQTNQYEEVRILLYGKVFRTFHGQNAHGDAKAMWSIIEKVNRELQEKIKKTC